MGSKTGAELEAIAPRIWYEWTMLNWAYDELDPYEAALSDGTEGWIPTIETVGAEFGYLLDTEPGTGASDPGGSALLECLLLHVRVLRNFLCRSHSSYDDEVFAVHFFDGDWTPPSVGPYLSNEKDRIDKALAHLSYKRIEFELDKKWYHHTIQKEMAEMWNCFWSALPTERQQWFASNEE